MVNIGFSSTSFSVYQPYIVELPGMGDSLGSVVLGLRALVSFAAMFFVNRYYERLNCRAGIALACLMTAAGFLVYGFADGFALLCAGSALTGAGYGLGGMIGMTLLVNRWFDDHVGGAVGFAAVGSGVASIVVPVVAANLIAAVSLRASFWLEAACACLVAVLVYAFLRNEPPRQRPADGPRAARAVAGAAKPAGGRGISKVENLLMLLAMFLLGCVCVAGMGYFSILLTSSGYDKLLAAHLLSVCGVCLTVSKFLTGQLFDKLGARPATMLVYAVVVVGLAACCAAALGNLALAVVGAVCLGGGLALGTVGIPLWSLQLSTDLQRARTVRDYQMAYIMGGSLFNLVPGVLKDLVGNYLVSFALLAAFALVSGIIVTAVYGRHRECDAGALRA